MNQINYCPSCGRKVEWADVSCAGCGHKLYGDARSGVSEATGDGARITTHKSWGIDPALNEMARVTDVTEAVFEIGKILLKVNLDKSHTARVLSAKAGVADERILLQKVAKFWNQQNRWDRPDGLLVVTTHRLVFLSKLKAITTTTDFLSIPLELIGNIRKTRVMMMSPAIEFEAEDQKFVFTLFAGAQEILDALATARQRPA
jgi:PH (Pleckstrin Homology) domain-containing protein